MTHKTHLYPVTTLPSKTQYVSHKGIQVKVRLLSY